MMRASQPVLSPGVLVRSRRALLAVGLLGALVGPMLPGFAAVPVVQSTVVRRTLGAAAHTDAGVVAALAADTLLVGVTWPAGAAEVDVRWRIPGGWTPWAAAETEPGTAPGGDGDAGVRPGTEPLWPVRGATAVGVRLRSVTSPSPPQLLMVGERTSRTWQVGGTANALAATTTGEERLGRVVSRLEWGADESLRKRATYQSRVDAVVVHHTVNANDYTETEAPSIVRSIYAFHVRGRGYDDIAYNLLVDRFGRVFEGRAGGFRDRAIKGSHTGGFNQGTLGVAMIGQTDEAAPAPALADAVARVAAWAADRWGFDPRRQTTLTSKGSSRYPNGRRVTVPRLLGHRDLSNTACPGRFAYPMLPDLRERAWHLLAPVITDVVVEGAPVRSPEPLRIRARLTAPAAWTITVTAPYGEVVSSSEGIGVAPALEWDGRVGGLPALPGEYTWSATADDGVHGASAPATGTVLVGPPALGI